MTASDNKPRSVSINPAFFQEIKEENQELQFVQGRLQTLVDGPQDVLRNHKAEFLELIELFRDQLAFHFALEEAYGYFEDALQAAPHLHAQSCKLRGQHAEIYSAASKLAESVAADSLVDLREQALQLLKQLSAHEAAEREMITSALQEDIGAGD